MARVIPNENTWIAFSETMPANIGAPTLADLGTATDITCLCSTINASAQGNAIPTPDLCTLFEKSIVGTSSATFTGDFYRDDIDDAAWEMFPRGTRGVVYISRFGGSGTGHMPTTGDTMEVWPVEVTSRAAGPLSSNTPQTFTVTCAVNEEPSEDAVVAAA
jgi:hypothetical protein